MSLWRVPSKLITEPIQMQKTRMLRILFKKSCKKMRNLKTKSNKVSITSMLWTNVEALTEDLEEFERMKREQLNKMQAESTDFSICTAHM